MCKKQILGSLVLVAAMCGLMADDQPAVKQEKAKTEAKADAIQADAKKDEVPAWRDLDRWSFQFGAAFITESTIDDIMIIEGTRAKREDEGEIYLLQASYKLAALQPQWGRFNPKIDLELPLVLGIVNESERDSPFMQYNVGFTVRWKSFPWNKYLYTNLETGCGLTYSQYVLATERVRHPDRERSHWEFYWPIQLMLAHPRYPQHQLVMLLHHHSGGTLFHKGGANSLGVGYRYVPGERH
jgi:hypothetical protein